MKKMVMAAREKPLRLKIKIIRAVKQQVPETSRLKDKFKLNVSSNCSMPTVWV